MIWASGDLVFCVLFLRGKSNGGKGKGKKRKMKKEGKWLL